jgi:putative DNA primase/helicase
MSGKLAEAIQAAREMGFEIQDRSRLEQTGPTVIEAIKALDSVCDGAATKDGCGFSKFDREEHDSLIEKAISEGYLSPKEEKAAYRFLKKYKKQLKGLGVAYDDIGHIARDGDDINNGLAEINERIPEWIAEHHFKTVKDTERLYRYDHGVYLDDGETILKALLESEFGDKTSNRLVADVVGKVKRRTYIDRDSFNNKHIINVRNGLLDLETLQLRPHIPDYLSTAQIDVAYSPEARAPRIQKFLREVAQPGDVALIEEIVGWLLWPDYNVHKAVMLLGPGRNGKGTLLRLITAFLGQKSISNVTLQELVSDRFAKADLYGKLANIGGDLPSKDLSDTAAFRNLTGGDDNRAQEKYRAAFSFRNKAKMLFSANVLPRSPDDTYAFYSRWILIEFLNVFDLQKGTADPDLDAKLQDPEELSGLLNIALAGLARLRANGWKFSYDKTVEDVEVMYKRNANPVYAFLLDECEPGEAIDYIEKTLFYNAFRDYAQAHGIRPLSSKKFSELLIDQTEVPVSTFRPYIEHGNRPMCWQGVKFKGRATVCQSRMSRVPPTPSFPENEIEGKREEKKIEGEIGIRKTLDILDVVKPEDQRQSESGEKSPASAALAEETRRTAKPSPTDLEKVRIMKPEGYRTQVSSSDDPFKFVDHLFNFGEVVEVQHWRAEDLIKRGIAEPAGTGA